MTGNHGEFFSTTPADTAGRLAALDALAKTYWRRRRQDAAARVMRSARVWRFLDDIWREGASQPKGE
jgi:uncharacterized protein (DUF2384 family)